ncbi:helix-turn-helix domain-containing protein [Lolliginicoccus levis]|uniref:helix-turn-helix domain-containing protein n=1 Tax=Lolliginicoccus levis TaxID=2919542 RepID=UPI00241DF556|nr:helix-turn-helix transcriptional regulator [Lolliginicoccus levis]
MPETPRMTGARLRVLRERLGLPVEWLAERLGVNARTLERWEHERNPIPDGVAREVEALDRQATSIITATVSGLREDDEPIIETYRTNDGYRAHEPGTDWPASWHRALAGRIAERVPGVAIVYRDGPPARQ